MAYCFYDELFMALVFSGKWCILLLDSYLFLVIPFMALCYVSLSIDLPFIYFMSSCRTNGAIQLVLGIFFPEEMKFSILSFLLFLLLLLLLHLFGLLLIPWCSNAEEDFASSGNSSVIFQIGVVLDLDSDLARRGMSCLHMAISDFYSVHSKYKTRVNLHVRDSKQTVIDAAAASLHLLKDVKVDAIIGPQKSAQASFVSNLGDRAHVPIISFSATNPSLHNRSPYFIQTAQSDDMEVAAVADIVKAFKWNQVVIICEDSEYGNGIVHYLSNALQRINVRVSGISVIPLSATDAFISKELYQLMVSQTRVFVVHMSNSLGAKLFSEAKKIGMMSDGYAWIITSGLTDLFYLMNSDVRKAMQGVLGVKPLIPKTKRLEPFVAGLKREFLKDSYDFKEAEVMSIFGIWAYDTMWALAMAAERLGTKEPPMVSNNPVGLNSSDPFHIDISLTGPKLHKAILNTNFEGLAGNFSLKDRRLKPSSYQILNVVENGEKEVAIWNPNHGIISGINASLKDVVWPGESTLVPKGWEVPIVGKKLRVGVPVKGAFKDFVRVERDKELNQIQVSGYYIDVFKSVMSALPYAVPYDFVPFEKPDGSSAGNYNDLVEQVSLQNFDAAVGDITITALRSNFADFTLPFTEGGVLGIVPIAYEDVDSIWTFLKPLTKELWLTSIVFFIFTGMAVWILEHRLNSDFRGPPSQHVGMILYFSFSTLVFAHRERIVSNLARLVVVVWMFVILILSSTYTASLSSRLTIQRLEPAIKDVKQLIKNGDFVGCPEGSFIIDLLKEKGFQESKIKTYRYPEDSHDALSNGSKNGGISAFFDSAPYAKLFLSKYCTKYTIGPTYSTDGFAFAFPRGSPLVADVSRAVIEQTENGKILEIGKQGLRNDAACTWSDSTQMGSTSVTLQCFKGLFAITGGITGSCLLVFLVSYVYQNRTCLQTILDSKTTLWSKIVAICRHFGQRDTSAGPPRDLKEKIPDAVVGEVGSSSHISQVPDLSRISSPSSAVVPLNMEEQNNANVNMGLNTGPAA